MTLKLFDTLGSFENLVARIEFSRTNPESQARLHEIVDAYRALKGVLLFPLRELEIADTTAVSDMISLIDEEIPDSENSDTEEEVRHPWSLRDEAMVTLPKFLEDELLWFCPRYFQGRKQAEVYVLGLFDLRVAQACYWAARMCLRLQFLGRDEAEFFEELARDWATTGRFYHGQQAPALVSVSSVEDFFAEFVNGNTLDEELDFTPDGEELPTAIIYKCFDSSAAALAKVLDARQEIFPNPDPGPGNSEEKQPDP